jgi:hypothetical protein
MVAHLLILCHRIRETSVSKQRGRKGVRQTQHSTDRDITLQGRPLSMFAISLGSRKGNMRKGLLRYPLSEIVWLNVKGRWDERLDGWRVKDDIDGVPDADRRAWESRADLSPDCSVTGTCRGRCALGRAPRSSRSTYGRVHGSQSRNVSWCHLSSLESAATLFGVHSTESSCTKRDSTLRRMCRATHVLEVSTFGATLDWVQITAIL